MYRDHKILHYSKAENPGMSRRDFLGLGAAAVASGAAAIFLSYSDMGSKLADFILFGPEDLNWLEVEYEPHPRPFEYVQENITRKYFVDENGDFEYNTQNLKVLIEEKNIKEYGEFDWGNPGKILIPIGKKKNKGLNIPLFS
jgi:hypothetical protein